MLQQKPPGYLLITLMPTPNNVFTYCWRTFYEMCSYVKKLIESQVKETIYHIEASVSRVVKQQIQFLHLVLSRHAFLNLNQKGTKSSANWTVQVPVQHKGRLSSRLHASTCPRYESDCVKHLLTGDGSCSFCKRHKESRL